MGSLTIQCVQFCAFPNDHAPRHVHGFIGETIVIVDLLPGGNVCIAGRKDAIRPPNAKRSDIRKALALAAEHSDELNELWEKCHGEKA
jgi:Domain of unknown function (DUF4160)